MFFFTNLYKNLLNYAVFWLKKLIELVVYITKLIIIHK